MFGQFAKGDVRRPVQPPEVEPLLIHRKRIGVDIPSPQGSARRSDCQTQMLRSPFLRSWQFSRHMRAPVNTHGDYSVKGFRDSSGRGFRATRMTLLRRSGEGRLVMFAARGSSGPL